ncbi:MAG: hypothetical protein U0L49_07690 [Eubacterium sp.]|nr:hypothetical protein [Eubacterium sp.]
MFDKLKLKKKGVYEFTKNPGDILLAVADDRQGMVPRFEEAEAFTLTVIRDGKKVQKQTLGMQEGSSEEDTIKALKELKVDGIVARNFMPKNMAMLRKNQIRMYFFNGGPNAALKDFIQGSLKEA